MKDEQAMAPFGAEDKVASEVERRLAECILAAVTEALKGGLPLRMEDRFDLNKPTKPNLGGDRMLTTAELARFFQVTERTVCAWMRSRKISYYRIGRSVRFRLVDVIKDLDAHNKITRK
jgi:excisionase family DNA binding protein